MKRYEISPAQWKYIKDLFPYKKSKRGRPSRSHYEIFNGILWVLFSGASWRDVPERYGPWKTVYDRFNGNAIKEDQNPKQISKCTKKET